MKIGYVYATWLLAAALGIVTLGTRGSPEASVAALDAELNAQAASFDRAEAATDATYAAAVAFYQKLSTAQKAKARQSWSLSTARHWSNLPAQLVSRNGIAWGDLTKAQKTAALKLIRTALSTKGAKLQLGMMAADNYLADNGGGSSYGEDSYYIAFLGTPSTSDFWVLQITGHHLTYNIAFNGTYKSPTPLFLGVEPKAAFTQDGVQYDPMVSQRTAVSNLGAALTAYSGAKLSGTYSDLLFGANGSGNIDGDCPRSYSHVSDHGLPYASLSAAHQTLVKAVIRAYVNTQSSEYVSDLLGAYLDATALAQTYVAYAGTGTVTRSGDYFRIEGPRVWIEFSVQRGVIFGNDIHYHTIWRDKVGDYGGQCVS